MSVGNIIGSNICNLLLILGLSAIIKPVKFQQQTKWIENPLSIILTIIFFIMCNINQDINRTEGALLIILFILFLIYTIIMGIKSQKKEVLMQLYETQKINTLKNTMLIILGIAILKIGGDLVVHNSEQIARILKVSDKIISLTIVAIGTSLPELVTSVTAAIKGDSDIAIGNIVGSNIFNMLLIIGLSALITPIKYNITYNMQMFMLFIGMITMLVFPFIKPKDTMSRVNGMICVILYIIYLMNLIFV